MYNYCIDPLGSWKPKCKSLDHFQVFKGDGSVEVDEDVAKNVTLWYMLDEFGSRFSHSDEPNMAFKLFFYVPTQLSYTLIYPIKDIDYQGKWYFNLIELGMIANIVKGMLECN